MNEIKVIQKLIEENLIKDKAIELMAEELTTPIHSAEWVKNYYIEKASGLWK